MRSGWKRGDGGQKIIYNNKVIEFMAFDVERLLPIILLNEKKKKSGFL